MTNELRKASLLALLAATVFGLAACNTMRGAGEDVEKVGEEIQEEVDQHD